MTLPPSVFFFFCSGSHDCSVCRQKIQKREKVPLMCLNCGGNYNAWSLVCPKRPGWKPRPHHQQQESQPLKNVRADQLKGGILTGLRSLESNSVVGSDTEFPTVGGNVTGKKQQSDSGEVTCKHKETADMDKSSVEERKNGYCCPNQSGYI